MVLTRQTPRFAELAAMVELELAWAGMSIAPDLVDAVLNAQVDHVAQLLGIESPRALNYAPDELGFLTALALMEAMLEEPEVPTTDDPGGVRSG